MSEAIVNLQAAQQRAMANRPKVGGFPYLAETLRQAGVKSNTWTLPSLQSVFLTEQGPVVMQGTPLTKDVTDVPSFDEEAVIKAIRSDQAGESTFSEFLASVWEAGVISYKADFQERKVTYYGCNGESYAESYPEVKI